MELFDTLDKQISLFSDGVESLKTINQSFQTILNDEENLIKKVGGKTETRRFLETLGFVVGGNVTVVSTNKGNLIVNIKDSRVAISREMANKIMV